MALAVYGKHPAKGDFLEHGIPRALKPALEAWLDATLAEARETLGPDWQAVWPEAPMLRFWLGEGIWGAPVAGVIAPAQDRVGRRFPLVLLALGDAGSALPPPVIDADQTWYDAACAHLATVLGWDALGAPSDLLKAAPVVAQSDPMPGPREFWAVRPGMDVGNLLADIALTDHRRASEGRSYWWVAGSAEPAPLAAVEAPLPVDLSDPAPEAGDVLSEDPTENAAISQPVAQDLPLAEEQPTPEPDPWGLAELPEPDDSPFDAAPAGFSLFAPPEPGMVESAEIAPTAYAPLAPRVLWSQVWAGPGLPSGAVLAWFFRGHAGND